MPVLEKMIGFIPSKDLDRARSFYEGLLGLQVQSRDGFALVFEVGGRMLRILNLANGPAFTPFPFTLVGWEVEDVRETVRQLGEKGVVWERYAGFSQDELGIWTAPTGDQVAWFKDPDDNLLSVSSHCSPARVS